MEPPTRSHETDSSTPFDGFHDLYAGSYRSVVRAVLPLVVRIDLAEEIAQEAFAAASTKWRRVSRLDRPDLWVRRVAINLAISARRRMRHETLGEVDGDRPGASGQWSPDTTAVLDAIDSLPRRQAQVIALVYFGGLRVAEAARALSITDSAARTHHRRALEKLSGLLGADETEPRSTDAN